jgi:hypothetical protein
MKRLTLLVATAIICTTVSAQNDTTKNSKTDTIRIGSMVIVKNGEAKHSLHINVGGNNRRKKNSRISTNWFVLDLGFSNYIDKTDYATAGSYLVNRSGYPALDKNDFKLRTGKSVNVNIWFLIQQLTLVKHFVSLKYGLGLELNNYRYKSSISYREKGPVPYSTVPTITNAPFIFRDSLSFSKNKLAADYLTVPLMLNFSTRHADSNKGLSLGLGVSAGYLYSERNKQKSAERGKRTNKGDYDLERFKFSYQAELGLGPIHLYGSYSPNSIYQHGLDMRPFTIGLRFTN